MAGERSQAQASRRPLAATPSATVVLAFWRDSMSITAPSCALPSAADTAFPHIVSHGPADGRHRRQSGVDFLLRPLLLGAEIIAPQSRLSTLPQPPSSSAGTQVTSNAG